MAADRWWIVPGELLWRGDDEEARLLFDDGSVWGMRLYRVGQAVNQEPNLWWNYEGAALRGGNEAGLVGDQLAALTRMLQRRSPVRRDRLTPAAQQILDMVAETVQSEPMMTARRIRLQFEQTSAVPAQRVNEVLESLWPRYLERRQGMQVYYTPTLLGLLESAQTGRVSKLLEDTLALLAAQYVKDPDARQFSWSEVAARGGWDVAQDQRFAANVYRLASWSERADLKDNAWFHDVPEDIEDLRRCKNFDEYLEYTRLGKSARPWPTCPVRLPEDDADRDEARRQVASLFGATRPARRQAHGDAGRSQSGTQEQGQTSQRQRAKNSRKARTSRGPSKRGKTRDKGTNPEALLPQGSVVGDWRIVGFIGRGGQGAVWEVKPVKTTRSPPRALKASFSPDERDRARFKREAEILLQCKCEHVLSVVDSNLSWQAHVPGILEFAYYVAEKFDGSLKDHQTRLGDLSQRLSIFRQACKAVEYAHSLTPPVFHRDIKPANFLLGGEPRRVVLADFGIARREEDTDLTGTHEVVGSRFFRAPEILSGAPPSALTDVYSLGRLLEWVLTDGVSHELVPRPLPRGGLIGDDTCDVLDRVVTKAAASSPADRYASARELREALPDVAWSVKRQPPTPQATPDDPATLLSTALNIARSGDRIAWRQLETDIRRSYEPALNTWREAHQNDRISTQDELFGVIDELVRLTLPRVLLPLAGVYSEAEGLIDQRRVIDDLVSVADWPRSGSTTIVSAPRGLVYVFHYLHGALCCRLDLTRFAVQLAQVPVPKDASSSAPQPLWQVSDIVGWPDLFGGGGTASRAWKYLRSLPERFPVLMQFFGLTRDYELGLASYSMLLSLLELVTDSPNLINADPLPDRLQLDVPPVFVEMPLDLIRTAAGRIFGDDAVVSRVAALGGAKREDMKKLWPAWCTAISSQADRARVFHDDLPLGDLA